MPKRFYRTKPIFSTVGKEGTFRFFPAKDTGTPQNWFGTYPEWLVYRELTSTHKLKQNEDFSYQTALSTTGGLAGRLELGGQIADFLLPGLNLVINPISDYYHYATPEAILRTQVNHELLAQQGLTEIWIDSGALEKEPKYLVTEALNYRDHSLMSRLV